MVFKISLKKLGKILARDINIFIQEGFYITGLFAYLSD